MEDRAGERPYSPLTDQIVLEQQGRTQQRKELISKIEGLLSSEFELEDVRLLTYITNFASPLSSIQQPDISPLEDVLANIRRAKNLFMIIDSPGGDADVAQKIIKMCRQRSEDFYTVVPSIAKSAATMMCLGSDKVFMGYLSELGPIDPQITTPQGYLVSAQFFLEAYEVYAGAMRQQGGSGPFPQAVMLSQLDPAMLQMAKRAIDRTRKFTKEWLETHMLRKAYAGDKKRLEQVSKHAKDIAGKLLDTGEWLLHSSGIDVTAARELGIIVEDIPMDSEIWREIWKLHVLSERHLQLAQRTKLFESSDISMHR